MTTEQMKMEIKHDGRHWALYVNGKKFCTFGSLKAAVESVPEAAVA